MVSYIDWQLSNKTHIQIVYNIIVNNLEDKNILIKDKKKLYIDIIRYLYNIKY